MLLTLALVALAAPVAPAAPPPQDKELKEQFKDFDKILSSRTDEEKAIAMMDGFMVRFKAAESRRGNLAKELEAGGEGIDERALKEEIKELDKEMDALAETVHEVFTHSRRKEINEANLRLWKVGSFCLGQMGKRGADYLWEVFEDKKRFGDEPDFRGDCLVELGRTQCLEYMETLVDLLDHSEYLFIAKAAEGLAFFKDAPGKKRHDAVDTCVKLLAEYYEAHASDPQDVEAQEKYRKTGPSMIRALEALTGVTQPEPLAWRTWFNKHKDDKELWSDE